MTRPRGRMNRSRPLAGSTARRSALAIERLEARELLANSFLQGLVFHDLNQNGVYDPTDPRLAGATVALSGGPTQRDPIVTGVDGTYLFADLAPGTYTLTQTAPVGFWESAAQGLSQINPFTIVATNRIDVVLLDPDLLSASTSGANPFVNVPPDGVLICDPVCVVPPAFRGPDPGPVGIIQSTITRPQPFGNVDIQTLCVELRVSSEWPIGGFQPEPLGFGNLGPNAGRIGYLYNRHGLRTDLAPAEAAGLQMAVWELLYDPPDNLNLETGVFRYVAQQPERQAILDSANAFIAESAGRSELALFLRSDNEIVQHFMGTGSFNFGNQRTASLEGFKWHDLNANAQWEESEPALSGWTIEVLQNNVVVASALTGPDGRYRVENLRPGTYDIREVLQPAWFRSYPGGSGVHTVTLVSGQNFVAPPFQAVTGNFGTTRKAPSPAASPTSSLNAPKCASAAGSRASSSFSISITTASAIPTSLKTRPMPAATT